MKYAVSLVVGGRTVRNSEFSRKGQMTVADMRDLGDHLYFRYVWGPPGTSNYPEADLLVTSKAPIVNQRLRRRANSNAAGVPDLWKQISFERHVSA